MGLLQEVAVVLWLVGFAVAKWGTFYTLWRMHFQKPPRRWPKSLPPVSILKPLKGCDPNLEENLETFAQLDYPHYEVIFSVADDHDPALAVVRRVCALYPDAPFRVIIGARRYGANPKVNNLAASEAAARFDTLLVSDSAIRVKKDYLHEIVSFFRDERCGIVSSPVRGYGGRGIGGALEQLHLNTFCARGTGLAKSVGEAFVMGASMMYSRSAAMRFGGVTACADYVNEDYMMGVLMKYIGKKVCLSNRSVAQYVGRRSLKEFWQRHQRWSVIQKKVKPSIFALHPLTFSLVLALLATIIVPGLWWQAALFTLLSCYTLDLVLLLSCRGKPAPHIWLLRELIFPFIWLHALLTDNVIWRGHSLTVQSDGRVD